MIQTPPATWVRLRLQERIERGNAPPARWASEASAVWGRMVRVARPLAVSAPTLCIGGATMGGSGKTPLALAATAALAATGRRVVLVGHAYRAAPGRARFVSLDDDVDVVGDEALEAARALAAAPSARVVVAPTRQSAVDFAQSAYDADVLVLDGPVQLAPRRATLAWLAVDASMPWGRAGLCPPAGDLRAPKDVLLAHTDRVVPVCGASDGAWGAQGLLSWEELRGFRIGLVTCVARPERIIAMLTARGVRPVRLLRGPDHGPLPSLPKDDRAVDMWLTTGKDWPHVVARSRVNQAPSPSIARIEYHLRLPPELQQALKTAFPRCFIASRF